MDQSNVTERAVIFGCEDDLLVGILHEPEATAEVGIVVVVGGPQYRIGSHRQFVLLARAIARTGSPVLRFDYRGMGDSSGARRGFEDVGDDVGAAVAALLREVPRLTKVVLWGLCDGASAILLYLHRTDDRRVIGLCLLNPWVRSERSLAHTQVRHYYAKRIMQREFWTKLMRGRVAASALAGAARSVRLTLSGRSSAGKPAMPGYRERMASAWREFHGRVLLILSGDDYTAREFIDSVDAGGIWDGLWRQNRLERCDLAGADHTFSGERDRRRVEEATECWLESLLTRQESGTG